MNTMETQAMQDLACMSIILHAGSFQVCLFQGLSGLSLNQASTAGFPAGFWFQRSCEFCFQGYPYVVFATACVCTFCVYWTERALHTALLDDDPILDAPTATDVLLGADGMVSQLLTSTNPALVICLSSSSK